MIIIKRRKQRSIMERKRRLLPGAFGPNGLQRTWFRAGSEAQKQRVKPVTAAPGGRMYKCFTQTHDTVSAGRCSLHATLATANFTELESISFRTIKA
jgi:hypothetical protein